MADLPPIDGPDGPSDIQPISIIEEMQRSYLDYAMSVIVARALPDVRDGLKPVHRRILYASHESGYHWNRKHVKSAKPVADVMGQYHPHGDASIYDALVRMAQDWSMRVPLIDGQGNFGSIDGDPPAAMRYTESRLAKVAHELLEDIDKETVDFQENYDGTTTEPRVLPAGFPNLLVNGSGGIAVGMATNIPPHNLTEVISGTIALIDNPAMELPELMEIIPGPDFPTGALILGRSGIYSAYSTGNARENALEEVRIVVEGYAAVADAVLMAALEAGVLVSQQQRAGRQHRRPLPGAVTEGAFGDHGDAEVAVAFLERPIVRSCRADNIVGPPALAAKEVSDCYGHVGRTDSNFSQAEQARRPLGSQPPEISLDGARP